MNADDRQPTAEDPSDLLPLVYDELRRLAAAYLGSDRNRHTLQPTALVHEAYLKVAKGADAVDRTHFRALAARAMRQILVDHSRQRNADKRGGGWLRLTLDDAVREAGEKDIDLEALEDALLDLAKLDERKSRVVELRFFGGMTNDEVARTLSVSTRTAESDWFMARAWLRQRLNTEAS